MSTSELSISFVTAREVLAVAITLPVVGILVVSGRSYIRVANQQKFDIDDWFIVGSLVSSRQERHPSLKTLGGLTWKFSGSGHWNGSQPNLR